MKKITYKLIMPTFSKYLDITTNFLELMALNWPEAKENVVISVIGDIKKNYPILNEFKIVKNKEEDTLPDCIVNAVKKYEADYYFIFLGDAFIIRRINNNRINDFLIELSENNIEYCRLKPQKVIGARSIGTLLRSINTNERYSHSFVAFAATPKFILNEFCKNMTDRDFEIRYLKLALQNKNEVIPNRAVLKKNIFHILPSIQKGKWDLLAIKYLRLKFPGIEFSRKFKTIGVFSETLLVLRKMFLPFISNKLRIRLKTILSKTKLFDTDL